MVTVGDPVMAVIGKSGQQIRNTAAVEAPSGLEAVRRIPLLIAYGLHARPAALLAEHAKLHSGPVSVTCKGRATNGKSVVGLMGLGAGHGDTLTVTVSGRDADKMANELVGLIASGLGDPIAPITVVETPAIEPEEPPFTPGEEVLIKGTIAVPGQAVGQAVRMVHLDLAIPERGNGIGIEADRLTHSLAAVSERLKNAAADAERFGNSQQAEIFRAHLAMLGDPEMVEAAQGLIREGYAAEWSWRRAVHRHIEVLSGLLDARMAERAADLGDLERQVISDLSGEDVDAVLRDLPEGSILVTDELMPSELAIVPRGRLVGISMARGGPTSHAAILASSMGIPAIVALGKAALRVPNGAPAIIDGNRGELRVFPPEETVQATRTAAAVQAARHAENLKTAHVDCRMADGTRIEVFANLGALSDATFAAENGAEGCGLLRTEFLFMNRYEAPSEDEQYVQYQIIAHALNGRPLIIRTIDVGGDKPLPYLPLPKEDNPVLGLRGVRVFLREPELLRAQIRAILRVEPFGVCRIMVPMISSPAELRAVRVMVDEERRSLGRAEPIPLGAMVEIPAAAVMADRLAIEADFLSIGTNDLTQYVLAMDRGNPYVAAHLDAMHPGVLRLIAQTVAGATIHDRKVSVCGGAASDLRAASVLIGLGVRKLSATPAVVPDLKALIRTLTFEQCRALAASAMAADGPDEVRALLSTALPERTPLRGDA
jgi:phosphocarrier protein FPr